MTLLVAQSLYEMLAANQFFLSLRPLGPAGLLGVIVVFNWLPALALFLLWILFLRIDERLARYFLLTIYGLLFLSFFFQIHNASLSDWRLFPHAYLVWAVPATFLVLAASRFRKTFRAVILLLSPAVLLLPGLFLFRTWPEAPKASEQAPLLESRVSIEARKDLPPIFILVLDELSLPILLDESGQIDAERYPSFHALAGGSYWFCNATANADHSDLSIPSILTGNFPLGLDPDYERYPSNLLNLLQSHYDSYVFESWTRFCDPDRFYCLESGAQVAPGQRELLLLISSSFAHRILPPDLVALLRRTWGPFQDARALIRVRLEGFERFLRTVAAAGEREQVLFFYHRLLPHSPYVLSPEGQIEDVYPHNFEDTAGDAALLRSVLNQYRRQVMYVDNELGRFLAQLKERGLYEKSLLIVTADHGVSYQPEAPGRALKEVNGRLVNANFILRVPLFLKLPHQQEGIASDREVQLIDLVPTLADVLELEVPWEVAGRSVFGPDEEGRPRFGYNEAGRQFELTTDELPPLPPLQNRRSDAQALVNSGPRLRHD